MNDPVGGAWEAQRAAMGAFIRSQRELANISLRELSRMTQVSNAYLSQLERGLHDPTLRVLTKIGEALDLSIQDIMRQGGGGAAPAKDHGAADTTRVDDAILADERLSAAEKQALLAVYRSYLAARGEPG